MLLDFGISKHIRIPYKISRDIPAEDLVMEEAPYCFAYLKQKKEKTKDTQE